MPLRHALLGLLWTQPSSGYELTRRFDDTLAHAWHASHSQIYPELARLEELGLVEIVGEGARNRRTWGATEAGRAELRRWLLESEPNRAIRNESAVRWFVVFLLDPADRRVVLERELAHLEAANAELRETEARVATHPGPTPFAPVVDLGLRTQELMLTWLREQLEPA